MASAWGDSWGTAWGDSWGAVAGGAVVVSVVQGGGTSKRRKKRGTVIRFSDFESRDEYERALAMAAVNVVTVPQIIESDDDFEDDEVLLKAITMMVLH